MVLLATRLVFCATNLDNQEEIEFLSKFSPSLDRLVSNLHSESRLNLCLSLEFLKERKAR